MFCRHCAKAPAGRPRGLCYQCYRRREIRDLYPPAFVARGIGPTTGGDYPQPAEPTAHKPGSPGKMRVLFRRALARCQLWHPRDAKMEE